MEELEQKKSPLTPEEEDEWWLKNVYKGNTTQLTIRAVIMGIVLGGVMSLTNLYIGLKTGWGLGVTITASILSFSIWKMLRATLPKVFKTDMTLLENNSMKSTASSAGYSTGGTLVSATAAYIIVTGKHMDFWVLVGWTLFLGIIGVVMAIPMKKQMINIEKLPFPSGTATAETLKSLYTSGDESIKKTKSLFAFASLGIILAVIRDGFEWIKGLYSVFGEKMATLTISMETSLIMVAAGGIMGWKTAWSILFGGILNYAIIAPQLIDNGIIKGGGYENITSWSLWFGASVMVASGFTSFLMGWSVAKKAFSGMFKIFKKNEKLSEIEKVEVPMSWFVYGILLGGLGLSIIMYYYFNISFLMTAIAIIVSFFLAIVACRATGETDTTPVGALGKITQLLYGVLTPTNMVSNLMTASITAGIAGSSADLLTDLKTGYILGANPRKMFIAQFIGIFAGTAVVIPAFYLIVPTPSTIGSDMFPAPSAQVWAGVAKVLSNGLEYLHPTARYAILVGGLIGIILPILESKFKKFEKYIPSTMGIGLAFVIPFWNCLSMFIGALIVLIIQHKKKAWEDYIIPSASGIIAGESLAGVFIILYTAVFK
ncbi:OPT/YSL family transporter [bacterium]|nr:OPT/YSL family transporter [bacterium]